MLRGLIIGAILGAIGYAALVNRPEGPPTVTVGTIVSVCILAVVVSLVVRLFQRSR
jgi:hypothetical protein